MSRQSRGASKNYFDLESEHHEHDELLAVLEDSGSDYEAEELKKDMKLQLLEDRVDEEESPKKNINSKKKRKSFTKKPNFEEIKALTEQKGLDKETTRKRDNVKFNFEDFLKKCR